MERAPEPTPASSTRWPGPDVGRHEDGAQILGVDDLGARGHLQHHVAQGRSQDEERAPGRAGDGAALAGADEVVVRHTPAWVWNVAPATSVMR